MKKMLLKRKNQNWWEVLFGLFLLAWTICTTFFWTANPNLNNYSGLSLHGAAAQMVHGLMLAGIDLLVLWLGRALAKGPLKLSLVVKTWLTMWTAGVVAVLGLILRRQFAIADLYSACLPVLRNAMPLLSGLLLGILILMLLKKGQVKLDSRLFVALLLIFTVPFVFGTDLWGFDQGTNPLSYALIVAMGGCQLKLTRRRKWAGLVVFAILGIGLIGLMPSISMMVHGDTSTASRMTTVANPFLLLAATALLEVVKSRLATQPLKTAHWLIIIGILSLATSPAMKTQVNGILVRHTHHSTARLLLWSPALTVVLVLAGLILVCLGLVISRRVGLGTRIDNLAGQVAGDETIFSWPAFKKVAIQCWHRHFAGISLVVSAYVLALLSMLLMNSSWTISPNTGGNYNTLTYTFFARQPLVIMNTVLILAFLWFLFALTRHYFVSLFTTGFLLLVWVIANRLKIAARNEPILPADLKLAGVGTSILGMVSWWVYLLVGLALLAVVVCTVYFEKHRGKTAPHKVGTVISLLVFPLLALSSLGWNHQSTAINQVIQGIGDSPMFYNQLSGARINGPLVQFMNNVDVRVMTKPAGYSKAAMLKIRHRYLKEAKQINLHRHNQLAKQTIIFNLSESFADPRRVPGVKVAHNPIPNIDQLKKKNTGGLMVSSGYGGGTANMEYMTLTGFALANFSPTLPTPYTQLVVKLAQNPSIVGSFRHSTAIHPYIGTFYSRQTVYKKFGIQHFYFLGNKNYPIRHKHKIQHSTYQSDQTSYLNVLDQLHRQKHGQFIQLVTMQNHFPYNRNFYHHSKYYRVSASYGTDQNALADYTQGIHFTDSAVKFFIKKIDKIKRPITIVFYGDHLPGSIYGNSLKKDGLVLHQTDYFIYSNTYARKHGAIKKMKKGTKIVDPNDFIAMVLAQTNSKVNWYQALLTRLWQQLPAVALQTNQGSATSTNAYNTAPEFINQAGKIVSTKHWTKHQRQLWHDYRLVQYDVTAGHHYLVRHGQLH